MTGVDASGPEVGAVAPPQPTVPVTRSWLLLYAGAWLGFWLLVMLPGQVMLAQLARQVDPASKERLLSLFQAVMMVSIVLAVPLLGHLCDRTRVAWGRRRAWALGGLAVAGGCFTVVGSLDSPPLICVLLVGAAIGEAATLVALSAMIADQVPIPQRGRASAAFGVPQVLALAGGMVLVTEVLTDVGTSWLVIGVLAVLVALPFLLGKAEPPPLPGTGGQGSLLHSVTPPDPRRAPDYYWAMATRVLINAGNLMGTMYLLFYLDDVLGRPDPDAALLTLTLVYLVFSVVATWVAGEVSDRLMRRRPLVLLGATLQISAALALAVFPQWEAALVAAALLGLGYGTFLSVDQALTTDVLPDPRTRARDLGLVNAAQHVPIAPLVGFIVLMSTGSSYRALYAVAALVVLLGAVSVSRIRGVR